MSKQPFHPRVIYGFLMLGLMVVTMLSPIPPQCLRGGRRPRLDRIYDPNVWPWLCACIAVFLLFTGWREMNKRR